METATTATYHPKTTHKLFLVIQITLRALAVVATLVAASITFSNKQTVLVLDIPFDARYSYSPAFKFFAYANLIACVCTIVSMFVSVILVRKTVDPMHYFYLFLHDLIVTVLLMAGCAASTAIGYLGKYGNSHTGWMAICGFFNKFCNRATAANLFSYFGLFFYLLLTVASANKSRQIQI